VVGTIYRLIVANISLILSKNRFKNFSTFIKSCNYVDIMLLPDTQDDQNAVQVVYQNRNRNV
jgi:hypothetical protein